jgi:hypothetical protein
VLQGCHSQVSGLTYDPTSELVLVAGQGAPTHPNSSSSSGRPQSPHRSSHGSGPSSRTGSGGKETGLLLSAWKIDAQQQLHLAWVAGRRGGPPLMQRAVVGLVAGEAAEGPRPAPWQLAVSPLGEYVAVVSRRGRWVCGLQHVCVCGGGGGERGGGSGVTAGDGNAGQVGSGPRVAFFKRVSHHCCQLHLQEVPLLSAAVVPALMAGTHPGADLQVSLACLRPPPL